MNRTELITKMGYEEFMNTFFTKCQNYYKLSNKLKESYFFLVCQTISKHDPLFIDKFQNHKSWVVLDMLHEKYAGNRVPRWVYASSKKGTETKDIMDKYTKDEIHYVLETTQYELRSFRLLLKHSEEKAINLLKDARKVLKGNVSKRKI